MKMKLKCIQHTIKENLEEQRLKVYDRSLKTVYINDETR